MFVFFLCCVVVDEELLVVVGELDDVECENYCCVGYDVWFDVGKEWDEFEFVCGEEDGCYEL